MKAYLEWGADKVTIDRIEPTHYFRNRMVLRLVRKLSKKHQKAHEFHKRGRIPDTGHRP